MSAQYPEPDELKARLAREKIATGGHTTEDNIVREGPKKGRRMSALALRLASRLGVDPDAMVKEWPDDTLRRTKTPVVEEPQEDGSVLYKHNPIR